MSISIKKAAVYFALAKSSAGAGNPKVAIRFEGNGKIVAFGIDDERSAYDTRSAIINVLQNSKSKKETFLATSFPVHDGTNILDEKSLGMCTIENVQQVLFFNTTTNRVQSLTFDSANDPPWSLQDYVSVAGDNEATFPELGTQTPPEWLAAAMPADGAGDVRGTDPPDNARRMYETYVNAEAEGNAEKNIRYRHLPDEKYPDLAMPVGLPAPSGRVDSVIRHRIFNSLAWAIVGEAISQRGNTAEKKYPNGHNIGSVLRGPNDEILAWGINSNIGSKNNTLHGEVNLVLNYRKHAIDGAAIGAADATDKKPILYSTLEPCQMCSGVVAKAGDNLKCYYGQKDGGIHNSALERRVNNSEQMLVNDIAGMPEAANPKGRAITSMYAQRQEAAGGKRVNLTKLLDKEFAVQMQFAIQDYFDLKAGLTDDDLKIWEAGYQLLVTINEGVTKKRDDHFK